MGAVLVEMKGRMSGFKKLGVKGNVVHRVVFPGPTKRAGARRDGVAGRGLRRVSGDPLNGFASGPLATPSGGASARRAATPRSAAAPAAPASTGPSPSEIRQGQRESELLQRRVEKLSRLLTEQEEQLRALAGVRALEQESEQAAGPHGQAVQPAPMEGRSGEKRRAFMSKLFQANLDLRESVNRSRA